MEYADKLLDLLDRPNLPNQLPSAWVSRQIGVDWRTVGSRLIKRKMVAEALPRLGWRYECHRGSHCSVFVRLGVRMTVGEILDLADKLIEALAGPNPPHTHDELYTVLGIPWPCARKQLISIPRVREALDAAGLKPHPDGDGLINMTKIEEVISIPTTLPDGSLNMDKARQLAALTPNDYYAATDLSEPSGTAMAARRYVKAQARAGVTFDQLNTD